MGTASGCFIAATWRAIMASYHLPKDSRPFHRRKESMSMTNNVLQKNFDAQNLFSLIPPPDLSGWGMLKNSLFGSIRYGLTNDFAFKYALQHSLYGLKGLLAASLGVSPEDIRSIVIENPILPGETVDDKTLVLDIKLLLNHRKIIDIEMQVAAQVFFAERALTYLCRSFDQLKSGENYSEIKPCVQISILNGELFQPEDPRYTDAFYSNYLLLDKETGKEYSDKFRIIVISLKNIENAADKEDPNGIYQWAKLFTATTWEDITMIAEKNDYMKSVVSGLRQLTEDEKAKLACEAREFAIMDQKSNYKAGVDAAEKRLMPIIKEKDAELEAKEAEIARLKALLQQQST